MTYVYLKDPSVIITPQKPATPSNIIDQGNRYNDFTIRPNQATPSIATRSNTSKGSSSNIKIKHEREKIPTSIEEKIKTEKESLTPQTVEIIKKVASDESAKREKLPVPRTDDMENTYLYVIVLILSLTVLASLKNKKK